MASATKRYRIDGVDDYTIDYRWQSVGYYKIFAVACPTDPYGNGPTTHHRYDSGEICVAAGREPRTRHCHRVRLDEAVFAVHPHQLLR